MCKAIRNLLAHAGLALISAPWLYLVYLAVWDGNGMALAPFIVIFIITTGRLFSAPGFWEKQLTSSTPA